MPRIFFGLLVFFAFGAHAAEVAGVRFDDKAQLAPGGPDLVLNGAGLRTKFFIKVYAAGLYVTQTNRNPHNLVAAEGPRRVMIVMLRDVEAKQFSEAFAEGVQNNNTPQELERNKAQVDQFIATMHAINELKKGDEVRLDYLPESGTRIQINGEVRGKPIVSAEFYRMLLRVWLGENPVDADLKQALLGGAS